MQREHRGPHGNQHRRLPRGGLGPGYRHQPQGCVLCMKHEMAQMLSQGAGSIVNNSSVEGLVGLQGTSAYAASKHGVVGLTNRSARVCPIRHPS